MVCLWRTWGPPPAPVGKCGSDSLPSAPQQGPRLGVVVQGTQEAVKEKATGSLDPATPWTEATTSVPGALSHTTSFPKTKPL